jgi:drug/metabolite transporter (DMT)-like permease
MFMLKHKKDNWWFWLTVGLIAYLLVAPNFTIIRVLIGTLQPLEFTLLRSALIVAVSIPFILTSIHKFNRRNLTYTLAAGLCVTVATLSLTYGIKYSSASYAAVVGLLSPILLVILSSRFLGERIRFKAMVGIALATIGALVFIIAPTLLGSKIGHYYPLATLLLIVYSVFFTLSIIFSRKSNEAGLPLFTNAGLMAVVLLVVSFIGMYTVEGFPTNLSHLSVSDWIGIAYSGIIVVFIARVMSVASYERIGASTSSSLSYLSVIVSVVIPLVYLGESLSYNVVIGGIFILLGVYLIDQHQIKRHKHVFTHHQI